jgi:serine/threonine-protein kinase
VGSPTRFGKYDLLAQLATGGMAEIWLARVSGMAGFEKLVVIKRLLDKLAVEREYVEMFLDEARINARLTHSNIVQVLELGQVEGRYFMAMEYVPGLSVVQVGKHATQRLGDVPQEIACGIVIQACAGLHHAHEETLPDGTPLGIIHRDVSPQNLILTFEGLVKVLDFGIAKAEGRQTATRTGFVKGKFSYMSPEQCLGESLDRRSDVFALGIVLFELSTARRLFKRGSTYDTYTAITSADVPEPRSLNAKIDPAVSDVIMKALRRKPDDRFASAGEMQDALEQATRKAGLRVAHSDLQRFMQTTFATEEEEQRQLLAQALAGELPGGDATAMSPIAERAVADLAPTYARSDGEAEQTSIDPMPLLGEEDSGRSVLEAQLIPAADAPTGPLVITSQSSRGDPTDFDVPTAAAPPPRHHFSLSSTEPSGLPALMPRKIPPIYFVLGALGLVLMVIVAWLLAR